MKITYETRKKSNKWLGLAFLLVVVVGVGLLLARQDASSFEGLCPREYYGINKCPVQAMYLDDKGFPGINRSICLAWVEEEERFDWDLCGLCLEGCPTKVLSRLNDPVEREKHTVE
jgi:Na+-translocating ferredoxin:NAD+ oxidoreductase RNF subunit RnfB